MGDYVSSPVQRAVAWVIVVMVSALSFIYIGWTLFGA